jgi:hypothetical protein
MNDDKTIIHKLWWLKRFLDDQWKDRAYAEIHAEPLSEDICNEIDEIVQYIKENY